MANGHRLIAILLIGLGSIGISATSAAIAESTTPQKVAFVGFRIINGAMEPVSEVETNRAKLLDCIFVEQLQKTGRFEFVPIPKAIAEEIDKGPFTGECNGLRQKGRSRPFCLGHNSKSIQPNPQPKRVHGKHSI